MTLQMMTVGVRRGRFLLRLLAQRIDLKPCAGRKHEQFERAGVEKTRRRGSTVGVDQCGNFVFQHQGKNPDFSAGWRSEYLEETRVEVGNRHARQGAITVGTADHTNDGGSVFVEREIFHRFVVGKATCLPSDGMVALYDKERDSGGVAGASIEQRAQNLPL